MNATITNSRWDQARLFLDENRTQALLERYPWMVEAIVWFEGIKAFHQAEMEHVVLPNEPTPEHTQAHRTILTALIAKGEILMSRAMEGNNVSDNPMGLTPEMVRAGLTELYMTQRGHYGGMTEQRRAEILERCFNVRK